MGIATVVAINTFSSAADSANLDAVRQDLAQIGSSAQAYYIKPTMLSGGSSLQAYNLIYFLLTHYPDGLGAENKMVIRNDWFKQGIRLLQTCE